MPDGRELGEVLSPESVADTVFGAMTGDEPFLVLPHARVGESFLRKATDYDGWIQPHAGAAAPDARHAFPMRVSPAVLISSSMAEPSIVCGWRSSRLTPISAYR